MSRPASEPAAAPVLGPTAIAYVLLALTALFWAGSVIATRAVTPEAPPLALNFWRWVLAFVAIVPFTGRRLWAKRRIVLRHWRILSILSMLNMTAFGSLLFLGVEHTQGINGSILLGTMTINIVTVSWLFVGVRITRLQIAGLVIGFAGMLAIVLRGDPAVLATLSVNPGDPVMWLGVVAYGFYSAYLPRAPRELTPSELMTVLCAIGVVTCLPLYLFEVLALGRVVPWAAGPLLAIGYLGIFPSLLAQIFWVAGVNRVGPNTASYFIYLAPVFGTLMAIGFLGETLRWYHVAGIALVFIGIYAATARPRPS